MNGHYSRSWHGDLGPGKRPDELPPKPDRSGELLTAVQAGQVAGLSSQQIRDRARKGLIAAQLIGGRYYFRRGDAERLRVQS